MSNWMSLEVAVRVLRQRRKYLTKVVLQKTNVPVETIRNEVAAIDTVIEALKSNKSFNLPENV